MAAATTAPALRPLGTYRNPGLMILWLLVTVNIYWAYWLYATYRDLRAHAPDVTSITPGRAVGFLFIPIFNVYWFFRIIVDLPRSIARLPHYDATTEPPLRPALASSLVIGGLLVNVLGGSFHPGFLFFGESLLVCGFVYCQSCLNLHWAAHAGSSPVSRLAAFLALRPQPMRWLPPLLFALALFAAYLANSVFGMAFQGWPLRGAQLARVAGGALAFGLGLLVGYRWLRNEVLAIAAAIVVYAVLRIPLHLATAPQFDFEFFAATVWYSVQWSLLLILALMAGLRLRPAWLGLWIGSLAAFLIDSSTSALQAYLALPGHPVILSATDLLRDAAAATVFAFVLWGTVRLSSHQPAPA